MECRRDERPIRAAQELKARIRISLAALEIRSAYRSVSQFEYRINIPTVIAQYVGVVAARRRRYQRACMPRPKRRGCPCCDVSSRSGLREDDSAT
jgi:hypothetical protein